MKTILFSLLVPFSIYAGTFTHKFENVPNTFRVCHEFATTLTQRFISQTGNSTGFVACLSDNGKTSNFELTYTAEKRLPFATTDVFSVYPHGLYKTLKDCEEQLEGANRKFESGTGLQPFISYCRSEYETTQSRFSPTIIGFGEAKRNYWISGYFYSSSPYKFDSKSFVLSLKETLIKKDAEFAGAVSVPSLGYGTMAIHYYAKDKIPFELLEFSQSPKIEQCLENLERFNSALMVAGVETVTSYCGKVSVGAYWELTALFTGEPPIVSRPSVETFPTLEQCEGERTRLTEYYRSNVDKRILDGFCGYTDRLYKIIFIRTR